ncbi:MAG TPA: hypothetical protein VFM15_05115 [Gammaproteobacteria bacterium]|nr:hypothetical protein [Gammaproteobacteria bacterium]
MRRFAILLLALGACLYSVQTLADDNCGDGYTTANFKRSDLVKIKAHVNAVVAALGTAPAPYAKDNENWDLPTYACQGKGGFRPINTTYNVALTTDAQQQKLGAEYQKKILAAEARGDMQAVMKITQEMQSEALKQSAASQANTPVNIEIRTNNGDSMTIDPGAVVRDGKGFIVLRDSGADVSSGTESVTAYFDKQVLKDAEDAVTFDESGDIVVPGRLDTISVRIRVSGPKAVVEAMFKKMDSGKVLGQLSEKRTRLKD